ncbi:MAG TPA: hypothetical protein VFK44_06855 [Bacillales bacterium]|nr:hypothetical protein [Bacillales bacterium]
MEIYISPEFINNESQVYNIVDEQGDAVGYMACVQDEERMYVYGLAENESVEEDFKDLTTPFIEGLAEMKPDLDIYCHLFVGGKRLEVPGDEGSEDDEKSK